MIWTLVGLLFLLWLVGLIAHVGGATVHFLLAVAIIAAVYNLMFGRPRR